MRRSLAAALLLLAAACGSSHEKKEPLEQPSAALPGARGAAVEILSSHELEELLRLEDARSLGDGRLFELLEKDKDRRVRARAATALGRFPFPRFGSEVTEELARALEDPDLEVRIAAAFAMGVRADPAGSGTLLAYRNDPEPSLRASVVEAASKLPTSETHQQLLLSLRDADLSVRMEAAVGTARWDADASDANEVDRALLDALHPYRITPESTPKSAVEAELVWRILWALGRRKAELGRGPFLEYSTSEVPLERLFALRGLSALPSNPASVRAATVALVGTITASDWRIAYEATVALGRFGPEIAHPKDKDQEGKQRLERAFDALRAAAEHRSVHVRSGAMEALGGYGDQERVLALLQRGQRDISPSVRAAALRSRARIASPEDALETLERGARDDDPVVRAGVADAAGASKAPGAAKVLLALAHDPSLFVATRAVEQLGTQPSDEVRRELHGFLAHDDNGMRLAAVLALRVMPDPADVGPLSLALASSHGDVAAEVAFNALQNLALIATDEARARIEGAVDDPRPYVRSVARKLLVEAGRTPVTGEPAPPPESSVPMPGKDYPLWRFNPMVAIETSRGTMVFELFPDEAPVHVHNFLTLIEKGAYDRLTFHRVVPDFVVQGGDYRGDGNGARPYAGEALRGEFTPRKYARGSLGMPRNEDPDSGGSQFFVTHVPTPHLDGRYTIFGELRAGGEVLDRIEVGDRILSARLLR